MEKINADDPAMPCTDTVDTVNMDRHVPLKTGLTIRQQFAAMAMQGLFAGLYSVPDLTGWDIDMIAKDSVKAADALIAELNK